MRSNASKIVWAASLFFGWFVAVGCGGTTADPQDGGAGTGPGGSGGTGATGGSGGTGGSAPTGGSGGVGGVGGSGAGGSVVGCLASPPTTCPSPAVTFAQIQPIMKNRCVDACHNGTTPDPANMNAPIWPLADYKHASDWKDTIKEQVNLCTMPPKDAGVPMTDEERKKLVEWVNCKAPQ